MDNCAEKMETIEIQTMKIIEIVLVTHFVFTSISNSLTVLFRIKNEQISKKPVENSTLYVYDNLSFVRPKSHNL